jgi:hypothetical protein
MGHSYQANPSFRMMNHRHRPPFSVWWVEQMLASPKIQLGLKVLKGPIITKSRYEVKTEDTEVKELATKFLDRFFLVAASSVLEALEWGYSAHELVYDYDVGTKDLNLVDVQRYKPTDVALKTSNRTKEVVGFRVKKLELDILRPKSFHFVHNKNHNRYHGLSCLYGSFLPWIEEWALGGLQDIKKLWFAKNAYNSGILYYPSGSSIIDGVRHDNDVMAQEIANKMATGHIITIRLEESSKVDVTTGEVNSRWYFQRGEVNQVPGGLMEAIETSKFDQLEGMGVLTEVIQSGGEGFGSSTGRSIPVDIFFSTIQEILNNLLWAADRQFVLPALQLALGVKADQLPPYEIKSVPLESDAVIDEEGNLVESTDAIGDIARGEESKAAKEIQEDPKVKKAQMEGQAKNPGNRGQEKIAS